MKKYWLISAAMLTLTSTGAWATSAASPAAPPVAAPAAAPASTAEAPSYGKHHQPMTLEQARARAHKAADKLDKMTEEEWKAKQEKRRAGYEKWKKMTPEEKAAKKAAKKASREKWRSEHPEGVSTSAPAAAPATGAQ